MTQATSTKMESKTPTSDPFAPASWPGVTFQSPLPSLLDPLPVTIMRPVPHQTSGVSGCATCGGGATKAPTGPFMLPQPPPRPAIKIEIHTLRFGNPPWLEECAPTLDAWCERHQMPLIITSTWSDEWPTAKYCVIDMMRRFLEGDNDWMMFMDADVVLHPLAPRPYFEESGFHVRFDHPFAAQERWQNHWTQWLRDHFNTAPPADWIYRNTGVWACDRASAEKFLAEVRPPYYVGFLEQHQMNWWLIQAGQNSGLRTIDLDVCWNHTVDDMTPGWAFHIYGKKKIPSLLQFRAAGLLPDPVKRIDHPPAVPDFGKGAVVWPWKSTAAEWDELWHSHRSVLRHWSEKDWPLVLIGDARPDWWPGEFIQEPEYARALWIGVQCAERVLWMNDDIFLLGDQSPHDLHHARHLGDMTDRLGQTMVAQNSWRRGLGQVLMRCHHHGKPCRNFSTHTPYLYERKKAREVLDRFGAFHKLPFETAYHNWHCSPCAPCTEKASGPHDMEGKLWINPAFRQVTPEFRSEMDRRFSPSTPSPAPSAPASIAPPENPPLNGPETPAR